MISELSKAQKAAKDCCVTQRRQPDVLSQSAVMLHSSPANAWGGGLAVVAKRSDRAANDSHGKTSVGIAQARLLGPLRVVLEGGQDATPASPLRQAILAVLVTASDQTKARKTLQELFWGSAGADRASANLRTAIYLLKQDLAVLGPDVLRTNRQTVSLAPGRIVADPADARGEAFLEGMDLPLEDCELFEDWLREMRSPPHDAGAGMPVSAPAPVKGKDAGRLALALLPALHGGLSRADLIRGDAVCDTVARFVAQTTTLDVHDLRDQEVRTVPLPIESGKGATHVLQALVERRGKRLSIALRLHEATTRRLIWVSEPIDGLSETQEDTASAQCEALLEHMAASPFAEGGIDLFPWTAIAALFTLDDELIGRTEAQIDRMLAAGAPPIFDCLRSFTQVFKAHEGVASPDAFSADELCEILSRVPTAHPMLPLCQSLAGYSVHMLTGERTLAEHLIDAAYLRAPNMALNLDHRAAIKLMQGDIDAADKAFHRCLRTGAFSPWRYTYDVTGAMIALAKGDARSALFHANQALMRKPRFIGALRYAMAGFALAENPGDARRMQARILRLRPDHDLSGWTENVLRRMPPGLGTKLASSLQKNGLV